MLLALDVIQPIAVLSLPVRPVVGNDLGQGYAEGLRCTFWDKEKKTPKKTKRWKNKREKVSYPKNILSD